MSKYLSKIDVFRTLNKLSDAEKVYAFKMLKKMIAMKQELRLNTWYKENIVPRLENPSP